MPPLRVLRFDLWFHYEMPARDLIIDYTPIARDEATQEHHLTDHRAQFRLPNGDTAENLRQKLARLAEYAESQLTIPEIEIEGVPVRGAARRRYFQVTPYRSVNSPQLGIQLRATYYLNPTDQIAASRDV